MDQPINYELLAEQLIGKMSAGTRFKTVPSSTPSTTYGHGNGGLFSYPGLDPRVFSAMILPSMGLQSNLPVVSTNFDNPIMGIYTGVTASSGSEPTGVCDDPPTAGLSKLCMHTFVMGRMARQTPVLNITRIGRYTNYGESQNLQLLGMNPLAFGNNPLVPNSPALDVANTARFEIAKTMTEFAVAWMRDWATDIYVGNPTNNTAQQGRKYMYGLDTLINTGYRDAETGIACPAADSIVRSFGNNRVDQNGNAFVQTLTYMVRNLRFIAERAQLMPVEWAIVMRWDLFYEVTQVWPVAYYTDRNTVTTTGQTVFNSGEALQNMRDEMRAGEYLLIDGKKIRVILDDAIAETESPAGVFSSSLYIVPMTVLGGTQVTYMEHLNFDAPNGAMDAARVLAPADSFFTSDGGRFLWHKKPPTNFCVQMVSTCEARLILLTPHLAGRMTNIKYSPLMHERGVFTTDGYYANGGRTDRLGYGPSFYSPTA